MDTKKIKLLIIYNTEKEAEKMDRYLQTFGFKIIYATPRLQLGLKFARKNKIDLIIVNSTFNGHNIINRTMEKKTLAGISIIFFTYDFNEYITYNKTESLFYNKQVAFLFRPCSNRNLLTTIKLFYKTKNELLDHVYLKNGVQQTERVFYSDILFVEAGITSCNIYTRFGVYHASGSLPSFSKKLNKEFIKVHDKYMVNQAQITSFTESHLFIENFRIPIQKANNQNFKKIFLRPSKI
jgi:DNA-binding LytR/AlgR family response regulator